MKKRISAAEAFNIQSDDSNQTEVMANLDELSLDFDDDDFEEDALGIENQANKSSTPKAKKLPTPSLSSSQMQQQQSNQLSLDNGIDRKANASHSRARNIPPAAPTPSPSNQMPQSSLVTSEELQLEKEPIKVRETGFWRWKRVIVPPNAYVIHTRLGRDAPVTVGLGKSFRYNPNTDAYLVVPAAMQTIGIVARCITKEKQGLNILAYLQWQISDFSIAYKRLDVSDSRDPLGIVNAQLSEQAEAAIKDKIATMSVEEVLTDKAPVIEELTKRLEAVTAERSHEAVAAAEEGLGIKIVTVQIREAFVSSQKLWQDLQAPFRYQQEQAARISRLTMQNELHKKELESHRFKETREAETNTAIEQVKQSKQTEGFKLKLAEEAIRFNKEQETLQQKIQREEKTTLAQQASKSRLQTQAQETAQQNIQQEEETALARQISEQRVQAQQARLDHETQLVTLQQELANELEQTKLENEARNNKESLQTEQALHAFAEESRFNEAKMLVEKQRMEQEAILKKQAAGLKLLIQEQDNLIEAKALEARLARQRKEQLAQLELEEAKNRVNLARQEKEIELQGKTQEVHNLVNESDLLRRLIDNSADIAAQMPDIQELKVLQTGSGDFDAFSAFLAKILAVAENLGVPLKLTNATHAAASPPKKKSDANELSTAD